MPRDIHKIHLILLHKKKSISNDIFTYPQYSKSKSFLSFSLPLFHHYLLKLNIKCIPIYIQSVCLTFFLIAHLPCIWIGWWILCSYLNPRSNYTERTLLIPIIWSVQIGIPPYHLDVCIGISTTNIYTFFLTEWLKDNANEWKWDKHEKGDNL